MIALATTFDYRQICRCEPVRHDWGQHMANRSGELFVREEGSVCYKSKDSGSTEGKDGEI